ncbi:hypothetical protein [Vibrio sp. 10N.239.312.D08]|uniref:hypothetical protein n=1 Tax=Vibrio sp. 10N.239.312.D08 TaxID=3229978 RepID=UPI00354D412A
MISYTFKPQLPQSLEQLILDRKGNMVKGHLDIRIAETLTDKEPVRDFRTIDMLINIDFNTIEILWIKQHKQFGLPLGESPLDSETNQSFNWRSNTYSINGESKSSLESVEARKALDKFATELDNAPFRNLTIYRQPASKDYILGKSHGIPVDTKFVIFDTEEVHRGFLRDFRSEGKTLYFSSVSCLKQLIGTNGIKWRCFDSYSDMFDKFNTSRTAIPSNFLLAEVEIKK